VRDVESAARTRYIGGIERLIDMSTTTATKPKKTATTGAARTAAVSAARKARGAREAAAKEAKLHTLLRETRKETDVLLANAKDLVTRAKDLYRRVARSD